MADILETKVYQDIKETLEFARNKAYVAINYAMVGAYWNIVKIIIKAQDGNEKAEYGKELLKSLSKHLTKEYGKGFTVTNLSYMRQFYLGFQNYHELRDNLSWTHYRILLKVQNQNALSFYLEECIKGNWSTRELERQINTFYYERLLSSKSKDLEEQHMLKQISGVQPQDVIKDPYILEFLGLDQNNKLYEKNVEQALINHLQKFLLELGRGFSFVGRQKHINFEGEHFYIDLVFYNYILKCFVLIDLKVEKLTHQDIGQMQMYVNYYTRELMNEGDNLPIGIVLCSDKSDAVVKYTLPENNTQIFASKYMLYLPTEEELKIELERERNLIEIERKLNDDMD